MKKLRWTLIFEDEDLIIVDKPAPYLTIPDRYDRTIPNVHGMLLSNREQVFINHRIDKETSGLLVFTKNEESHKVLSLQFENREVTKNYYTLVHGTPPEQVGQIDLPIGQNKVRKRGMIIDQQGKESITKFRIVQTWKRYSLLEVSLITGRQHQIRVHMKAIYCPLICDNLYGDGEPFFLSDIKRRINRSKDEVERPLLKRLALHAYKLKFVHPRTGAELEFESELPKDMKAVIKQLDKVFL